MDRENRKRLAEQAYDCLYEKIVSCELLPAQAINEKDLLEITNVGRTPTREALLSLQNDGLVEIYPRKGMAIAPFTIKSVNDLYQTRKLIEPNILAEYKTLYAKNILLEYKQAFMEIGEEQTLKRFELDAKFHLYLVGITGNDILMNMYRGLMVQQVRLGMYASLQQISNHNEAMTQHFDIIDALLRENEQDVKDAIVLHINQSLVTSLQAIQMVKK